MQCPGIAPSDKPRPDLTDAITTLGFDADDTLWHNEDLFQLTQARFAELLADHAPRDHLEARLLDAERRNLGHYGFGVKGFVLSMIETALEITDNRVPGAVIAELIAAGQDMLSHPITLLPGVEDTVRTLADDFKMIVITKGDLLDQERKLAQSGLGDLFDGVEIVSDKTEAIYRDAFARHGTGAQHALMVGNSMRSDVLPALAAGAWGIHVPHGVEWALEAADAPQNAPRFRVLDRLSALPDLLPTLR